MLKTVLAGLIAIGFALPASAQVETYYLVQDTKTKKCTIVNKKPAGTEYTMVGSDGTVYKTRVEAESAMKTVKVCTEH
jgi:hypothetical protein